MAFINIIDVLQNGKGTNLPDDSVKQSSNLFCIDAVNHKLATELREVSLNSFLPWQKERTVYTVFHRDFMTHTKHMVVVLAPTGIAAFNEIR